jgi:hypothetical protein
MGIHLASFFGSAFAALAPLASFALTDRGSETGNYERREGREKGAKRGRGLTAVNARDAKGARGTQAQEWESAHRDDSPYLRRIR